MIADPSDSELGANEAPNVSRKFWFYVVGWMGIGFLIIAILLPVLQSPQKRRRHPCINNLKNIGLALQNYHDVHGQFPPAFTVDDDGKPLHSWRTLLLPFLDYTSLYDSIDLTKPWDDPVNAKALDTSVHVYLCPNGDFPENHTGYLAIVTADSCLRPGKSGRIQDITDGTSKTVVVIEAPASQAVPWMSPLDASEPMALELSKEANLNHVSGRVTNVLFFDGHVSSLEPAAIPPEKLRALLTIAGGDEIWND